MALAGFTCFLYIFALVIGLASLLLPFWISAEMDAGVRNVTVVKEIDSGLLWKRQSYYMRADSIPESDDSFEDISGTKFHTEAVKTVLGLMATGLVLLTFGLISSIFVCCCYKEKKGGKYPGTILILFAVITIIAGGFIVSGPIIYYKHVTRDYDVKKEHLGASCWLALTSAVITFIAGLLALVKASCFLRNDNEVY